MEISSWTQIKTKKAKHKQIAGSLLGQSELLGLVCLLSICDRILSQDRFRLCSAFSSCECIVRASFIHSPAFSVCLPAEVITSQLSCNSTQGAHTAIKEMAQFQVLYWYTYLYFNFFFATIKVCEDFKPLCCIYHKASHVRCCRINLPHRHRRLPFCSKILKRAQTHWCAVLTQLIMLNSMHSAAFFLLSLLYFIPLIRVCCYICSYTTWQWQARCRNKVGYTFNLVEQNIPPMQQLWCFKRNTWKNH